MSIISLTNLSLQGHDKEQNLPHLFNGELLARHLSHLGNGLNVLVQPHLEALGKRQCRLGLHLDPQLFRQRLPVPNVSVKQSSMKTLFTLQVHKSS